jgi:hypothetical protein
MVIEANQESAMIENLIVFSGLLPETLFEPTQIDDPDDAQALAAIKELLQSYPVYIDEHDVVDPRLIETLHILDSEFPGAADLANEYAKCCSGTWCAKDGCPRCCRSAQRNLDRCLWPFGYGPEAKNVAFTIVPTTWQAQPNCLKFLNLYDIQIDLVQALDRAGFEQGVFGMDITLHDCTQSGGGRFWQLHVDGIADAGDRRSFADSLKQHFNVINPLTGRTVRVVHCDPGSETAFFGKRQFVRRAYGSAGSKSASQPRNRWATEEAALEPREEVELRSWLGRNAMHARDFCSLQRLKLKEAR